ncbi:MAG: hypothetical protein AB1513_00980 [Pseudomonadota bacterium]
MVIAAMLLLLDCIGHSVAMDVMTPAVAPKGTASDISTTKINRMNTILVYKDCILKMADSSTKRNKDEPGDGWLRMPRHHGRSNRQVQVARCTSTSAEKNDTKSTVS